ncbi:uncharacterized protein J3D65DRAFT_391410 [Phyllosticta citribraziliensis]|uniref:Uncharacterized protein n=1 Tax=Phyllosticta citribraziliensis TaxID=989973 RepID=A0ABR1LM71_9PEZI
MAHQTLLKALCIFVALAASPLAHSYPISTSHSTRPRHVLPALPALPTTRSETVNATDEHPRCPSCPGNGDLYGLGIRLGIYLQWMSSHILHTVSPASAAATHDANSVFLLAILIALTTGTARQRKWIRAEEAYIVLLVAWGFVGTVVSVTGVRLGGLEGRSVCGWGWVKRRIRGWVWRKRARGKNEGKGKIGEELDARWWSPLKSFWARTPAEKKTASPRRRRKRVLRLTLGAASVVKHPSFSWAGVFWRSSILSYLTALNAWVWWSRVEDWEVKARGGKACAEPPTFAKNGCVHHVFFFGSHPLENGGLMKTLRILSIVLAVPALLFSVAIALVSLVVLAFVVQVLLLAVRQKVKA